MFLRLVNNFLSDRSKSTITQSKDPNAVMMQFLEEINRSGSNAAIGESELSGNFDHSDSCAPIWEIIDELIRGL
jgi:hypothetical protein